LPDHESNLRVIIVDDHPDRAADIKHRLERLGYSVLAVMETGSGLLKQMTQHEPDVIIIALDSPDRDVLESLSIAAAHNPRPVALFSGVGDSGFIAEAIRSGVTAYQAQGINPELVEAAIKVAVAQFDAYISMKQELVETQKKLEERKSVERAKGLLMKRHGMSETEAFHALRKTAMNRNCTLFEAAQTCLVMLGES